MGEAIVDFEKRAIHLTKIQLRAFTDFLRAYNQFPEHKQCVSQLVELTEQVIRSLSKQSIQEVMLIVHKLRQIIISSESMLGREAGASSSVDQLISAEESLDSAVLEILEKDIVEIRKNMSTLPDGNVKDEIAQLLQRLEQAQTETEKEQQMNQYLQRILQHFLELRERMLEILEKELSFLSSYENITLQLQDTEKAQLRRLNEKIQGFLEPLGQVLEKERKEVFEPYQVFTNRKYVVQQKVLQLSKVEVITAKDIKADLRKLSPEQADLYIRLISRYWVRFETPAAHFFDRFERYFHRQKALREQKKESVFRAELALLQRKASYDKLTNAFNRNFFDEVFLLRIREAIRSGTLVFFLFDVDHFKSVNDLYGHHIGDIVLHLIAKAVLDRLRAGDMLFRYGGEEFIVVFGLGTSYDGAVQVADTLRNKISEFLDQMIQGEDYLFALKKDKKKITVSGSLLHVTFQLENISSSQDLRKHIEEIRNKLIVSADKLLYSAKNDGRNRVYSAQVTEVMH